MLKKFSSVCGWGFLFLALVPCLFITGRAQSTAPDIERIKKQGKIVIAMYGGDMRPFAMASKKGPLFGIDVEIGRKLANQLGVEAVFDRQSTSFHELIDRVADRRADIVLSKLSKTLSRAERVRFSDTYITIHKVLLINRLIEARLKKEDNDPFKFMNQKQISIGVAENSAFREFARKEFPSASLKLYKDRPQMFIDLYDGKISAAYMDEATVLNWFFEHPKAAIRIRTVKRVDHIDPLAIAVNRDDTQLLAWINIFLELLKRDGVIKNLDEKYLKKNGWRSDVR